jgi:hypothetical protein
MINTVDQNQNLKMSISNVGPTYSDKKEGDSRDLIRDKYLNAGKYNYDELQNNLEDKNIENYDLSYLKFLTGDLHDTPETDYVKKFLGTNENDVNTGENKMKSLVEKYLLEKDFYDESPVGDDADDPENEDDDGIVSDEDYDDDTLDIEKDGSINKNKVLIDPMTGKNKPSPGNIKEVVSEIYDDTVDFINEIAIVDDINVDEEEMLKEFEDLICISSLEEHDFLIDSITESLLNENSESIKIAFKILENKQGFDELKDEWKGVKKGAGPARDSGAKKMDKKYFVSKKEIAEAFKYFISEEEEDEGRLKKKVAKAGAIGAGIGAGLGATSAKASRMIAKTGLGDQMANIYKATGNYLDDEKLKSLGKKYQKKIDYIKNKPKRFYGKQMAGWGAAVGGGSALASYLKNRKKED